jgi:hypothetical protein
VERRSEPRFKTKLPIEMILLSDRQVRVPALLTDVSMHGIGILVNRPIPIAAKVKITFSKDETLMGEVSHCAPRHDGFALGVQLFQALTDIGEVTSPYGRIVAILRDILLPV